MPWNLFMIKIYLALSTFRASFIAHKGYNYFPLKKLQLEVSLPQPSKTLKLQYYFLLSLVSFIIANTAIWQNNKTLFNKIFLESDINWFYTWKCLFKISYTPCNIFLCMLSMLHSKLESMQFGKFYLISHWMSIDLRFHFLENENF